MKPDFASLRGRALSLVLLCCVPFILSACASPTSRLRAFADDQGFVRESIDARGFEHTVFLNRVPVTDGVLHVYLEGDGSPWRHRTIVMADPTPRSSLMLRLMAIDDAASVYIGRPCYNGTSLEPGCQNSLWTSDRYSELVTQSMTTVLRRLATARGARHLRLFGHSGGGALAMLIAERMDDVDAVVTIAGNLDIDAWTTHHDYTPLYGSLNPASRAPLPTDIDQWHLVGEMDGVIPPSLVASFIRRQPNAIGASFAEFTHGCCWGRVWRRVLEAVDADRPGRLPGRHFKERSPYASSPASRRAG